MDVLEQYMHKLECTCVIPSVCISFDVYRSTFACNRVRTNGITKWVIKEFDNVEVSDQDVGIFYSSEAYVIRWALTVTVSCYTYVVQLCMCICV